MRNSHDNGRRERIEGWLDGWMNCLSVCGFEWVDESVRHLNYTMWLVLEVKHNMWLCVYIGTGGIQGTGTLVGTRAIRSGMCTALCSSTLDDSRKDQETDAETFARFCVDLIKNHRGIYHTIHS